ncbi:MAG: hypothetical protein GY850_04025 [bacterium]|nr:hypothetical protein [bacterium]
MLEISGAFCASAALFVSRNQPLFQDPGFLNELFESFHSLFHKIGFKRFSAKPQRQGCTISAQKADLAQYEHDRKALC